MTETYEGKRLQMFVYKGLTPVTKQDQETVWSGSKWKRVYKRWLLEVGCDRTVEILWENQIESDGQSISRSFPKPAK